MRVFDLNNQNLQKSLWTTSPPHHAGASALGGAALLSSCWTGRSVILTAVGVMGVEIF